MIISSTDSKTILLVRKDGPESTVEVVEANETQELALTLSEVGARLSDVFGADGILWVEGRTEEECFPLILASQVEHKLPWGLKILGVVATGDFRGRHSRAVLQIYKSLSKGRGIMPPAVGFIFDQEGRDENERKDLDRESKGAVRFIPRRMYENYLLDAEAISSTMTGIEGFRKDQVTHEKVTGWLNTLKWNGKYIKDPNQVRQKTDNYWKTNVDGAKLLADLFSEFSETRVEYDKVAHGIILTKWIISNKPENLIEIKDLLIEVIDSQNLIRGRTKRTD